MNNFNGLYYFPGKGFCGLFVFDDMGNAVPITVDMIPQQAIAFTRNAWHLIG